MPHKYVGLHVRHKRLYPVGHGGGGGCRSVLWDFLQGPQWTIKDPWQHLVEYLELAEDSDAS